MRRIVRIIIYILLVFCIYSLVMELSGRSTARNKKAADSAVTIGSTKP